MSDLVTRLRRWTHAVDAVPASELMDEAAGEIERLRLTDAERSAIADAADRYVALTPESAETVATLRGLLDRIGHQEGRDE